MKYFSNIEQIATKLECKPRTAAEVFKEAKIIAGKENMKYYRNRVPNKALNQYYGQPIFEVPRG